MTNNQEKLLRGNLTKWLQAKGETPEDVERKTNAWLQYFDGIKKPVVALAACTWLCSGAVILPEDMPKVEQAVKVTEINRVDPLRFDRPMAVFEAFPSTELKEAPIDQDTVPTLHLARRFDSGLAIYDVDETQESRENMRKIINTHFGKDSSPWCLLQGDGEGNLTEGSLESWNHYNAYPKQVAFVDGKLAAFSANSVNRKVWWDRMDESHEDIVVSGRIKGDSLGRSASRRFNPETGDVRYKDIVRRRDDVIVERYANIEDRDYTPDILVDPKKKEKITSVVIPDGVTKIGNRAFMCCSSLQEIYIPDGVTEIGDWAFRMCTSLQEIHIPDGVTQIGAQAFFDCSSLREIHIPESVTQIGVQTFYDCPSLREIRIPEGVKKIRQLAFVGCSSLQEFRIPDSVEEIEWGAFRCCTSLQEIRIPEGVTKIGWDAFKDSTSLKEVHVSATAPQALIDRIRAAVPDGCAVLRDIPEKDLAALRGRGVSEAAIRELQEKGFVHIKEKTFYRLSTETSPCPESARTVHTDVIAALEDGSVRMKDPKTGKVLASAASFFSATRRSAAPPQCPVCPACRRRHDTQDTVILHIKTHFFTFV